MNRIKKSYYFPIFVIFIASLFLGVGYSQVTDINLNISGNATAEAEKELLITNVAYISNNNANPGDSIIRDTYQTLMHSTITLGNTLSSSITYQVTIRNNTDSTAIYDTAVYSASLGYDNTDIEFEISGLNHGDAINSGEQKQFNITFKYNSSLTNITNNELNSYIRFDFNTSTNVARIGNTYYTSLQNAIDAAPNNTQTTILLLRDTSEEITVPNGKNIILNLQAYMVSNSGNTPVFYNYGIMTVSNGNITTNAATNGAFNNGDTGVLTINGTRIDVTGGRQALYNNNGIVTITGNAHLESVATERAAVSNLEDGTMTILSGTIISTGSDGIANEGDLIIGTEDGSVNTSSPSIRGVEYGIKTTTNISFYDGIVKGKVDAFDNRNKVSNVESGYSLAISSETIGGNVYIIGYLAQQSKEVTFNPNGGTVSETTRYVETGHAVGALPTPTYAGHTFEGWFTDPNSGTQVTDSTIITGDIVFYAHWALSPVARIGDVNYATIQAAVNAAPNNTQTTITILTDTSEYITIGNNKNLIIDLGGNTIRSANNKPIFETKGNVQLLNGSLYSTAEQSDINMVDGYLTIDGVNITATKTKQALYITGGTVEITGNSYLTSKTTGTANGGNTPRGTAHNISGTLIITGGTIVGESQHAISNESILIIGNKNGSISNTPVIRGAKYGILSIGTVNFYDGKIMGITGAIDGNIDDIEDSSHLVDGTETISNKSYYTKYLESN